MDMTGILDIKWLMCCFSFFRSPMSQHVHSTFGGFLLYAKFLRYCCESRNICSFLLILDRSFLGLHVQQTLANLVLGAMGDGDWINWIQFAQAQVHLRELWRWWGCFPKLRVAWPQKWLESGIAMDWHGGQSLYSSTVMIMMYKGFLSDDKP